MGRAWNTRLGAGPENDGAHVQGLPTCSNTRYVAAQPAISNGRSATISAVRAQRLAADCYRRWRRGIVGCPPDGGGRQAELLLAGASYRAAPAM